MSDDELTANAASPAEPAATPRKPRKPPPWILAPDQFELSREIARQLHEPERALLGLVIKILGMETARTLLEETLQIEAEGGWMLPDNSRRRTPGGVFLVLAKQRMTREDAKRLHCLPKLAHAKTTPPKGSPKPFDWKHRQSVVGVLRKQPGDLTTVKAVVMGRPDRINEQAECVSLTLTHPPQQQCLPRGLPTPGDNLVSSYTVYVASKQWKKVAAALANPDDVMIVEGLCVFNEQLGGMAVYATSATTRNLQMQQRKQP